jgi:hypothetical protein
MATNHLKKSCNIKLLAPDRRKLEKAMALINEVLAERFPRGLSKELMGPEGFRKWERLHDAQGAVGSALGPGLV